MLNIYIGKENLPKDKKFFFNANAAAMLLDLTKSGTTSDVLSAIEQATPQTYNTFIDRFGRGMYSTCLSTSTIILLTLIQLDDIVVNGDEIGTNAFYYLNNIKTGHLYFSDVSRNIDELDTPICINGRLCSDENELWDAYTDAQ